MLTGSNMTDHQDHQKKDHQPLTTTGALSHRIPPKYTGHPKYISLLLYEVRDASLINFINKELIIFQIKLLLSN